MKTPANTEKHSKTPTALIAVLRHATPTVTCLLSVSGEFPGDHGGMCLGQEFQVCGVEERLG